MGVGPVAYNQNFAQLVTYLTWIYAHEFVIFSPIPQEIPPLLSLIRPFPPMVWVCIMGTKFALTIISYLFLTIHNMTRHHVDRMQRGDARRMIISMSLFAGFMFGRLYSKSFLSSLIAKEFQQPIDTIQDVLNSGLTMHYPGKTAIEKYLVDYPSKEMKQIVKSQAKPFPFAGRIPSYVKDS